MTEHKAPQDLQSMPQQDLNLGFRLIHYNVSVSRKSIAPLQCYVKTLAFLLQLSTDVSFPPPQRHGQIRCILQSTACLAQALSAHTDLCREENPRGTQLIFVCWARARCPKLTQEEEMTITTRSRRHCSADFPVDTAFAQRFSSLLCSSACCWLAKAGGWNCYARACSSLANSIKYSRKRSSLIEPKILWLSWLNQLLFLQMTIPPFLSLLFRSLFPATPSFFFLFKV